MKLNADGSFPMAKGWPTTFGILKRMLLERWAGETPPGILMGKEDLPVVVRVDEVVYDRFSLSVEVMPDRLAINVDCPHGPAEKIAQAKAVVGMAEVLKMGLLEYYKSLECPRCGNWKDAKACLYSGCIECGSCGHTWDGNALEKLGEWAKKQAGVL
jgi:hypothetical protein